MLNLLIKKAAKQQIKLIIISLLCCCWGIPRAQIKSQDTLSFKRDFENLLAKYGIINKGYLINVTSINQSGGQTALVITNNYYKDTLLDGNNFIFKLSKEGSREFLTVSPKKGIWISPYVVSDSLSPNSDFFDPGIGVSSYIHGLQVTIENKVYTLSGRGSSHACSKLFPITIYLNKNDPKQFFIFGDLQDQNKHYLYNKGQVSWLPMTDY